MPPKQPYFNSEEKKRALVECHDQAATNFQGAELKAECARLFQVRFPDCSVAPATLDRQYWDIVKSTYKLPQRFRWDETKKQVLLNCHEEARKAGKAGIDLQSELARLFRATYPDCTLEGRSLLTYFYNVQKEITLPTGQSGGAPLLWQQEMEAHLKVCVELADAKDRVNIRLGLYHGKAGAHGGFRKLATELFNEKYPDFSEGQVTRKISELRLKDEIPQRKPLSSTQHGHCRLDDVVKYMMIGWSHSKRPLFDACCHRCCRLIYTLSSGSKKIKTVLLDEDHDVVPIERQFDENYLEGIPYKTDDGRYYVCDVCHRDWRDDVFVRKSAMNVFPLVKDSDILMPEPEVLIGLNAYDKGALGLCGLFSSTVKKTSKQFCIFEHRQGEVNILPKDPSRYLSMYAMIIEKNIEGEEGLNQSTVKRALNFLRKHNPLYEQFFANCETLYGFVVPEEGHVKSVPVYGSTTFKPADPKKKIADILGDDPAAVLIPEENIDARGVDMEGIKIAMGHVKDPVARDSFRHHRRDTLSDGVAPRRSYQYNLHGQRLEVNEEPEMAKQKIPDLGYASYGSKYLEEKVWSTIFWRGTGGYYKPEAHGWSRRDYYKYRTTMLYPGFRKESSWLFYQCDTMIKEMIRGYNFVTVKASEQVNPLRKKDLASDKSAPDDDGYNHHFGKTMPVTVPNSKAFMNGRCADLISMSAKLGTPTYLITLTQNDMWPEFQAAIKDLEIPGDPDRPEAKKRFRTNPTACFEPPCDHPKDFDKAEYRKTTGRKSAVDFPVEMVICWQRRFDLFMRIFIRKHNNVFGKVADYWWRVEYQGRGAIHVHMVVWLDKKLAPTEFKISAEMPRFKDTDDPLKEHPLNKLFRQTVNEYHKHQCRENRCFKGPLGKTLKSCKYGFRFAINSVLKLDNDQIRYLYVRSEEEDADVSSYILELLLFWDGHLNVQLVTDNGWEAYLAKYIAKCIDAEKIRISEKTTEIKPTTKAKSQSKPKDEAADSGKLPSDHQPAPDGTAPVGDNTKSEPLKTKRVPYAQISEGDSDVKRYLKMRTVNSLEAVMLSFGYPQVGSSREFVFLPIFLDPVSRVLKRNEHLKNVDSESTNIYYDDKMTKYFQRAKELENVTYPEYNEQYYVVYNRLFVKDNPPDYEYFPNEGVSDDEEQDDRQYREEESLRRKVFKDDAGRKWVRRKSSAKYAISRFAPYSPYGDDVESYCLVRLLTTLPARRETVAKWITDHGSFLQACIALGLVNKGKEAVHYLDDMARQGFSTERLREMAQRFLDQGWLVDPEIDALLETLAPVHRAAQIAREQGRDEATEAVEMDLEQLALSEEEYRRTLSVSQLKSLDWITSKWDAGKQVLCLITGGAGVGKSHLLKAVVAAAKGRHLIIAKTATTGIAGYNIGGTTLHYFLKCNLKLESSIEVGTWDAKTLTDTHIVCIDEVSMMNGELLDKLHELMVKFSKPHTEAAFGGKSIILIGDPAQLQPVQGEGIWSPRRFNKFHVLKLHEPQRQAGDPVFYDFLNRVRLGQMTTEDYDVTMASRVLSEGALAELKLDKGMILFPKRTPRNDLNMASLDLLTGARMTYAAEDQDENGTLLARDSGDVAFINQQWRNGKLTPPMDVVVKKGAKAMLLRNIEVRRGWVNGAICIVEDCGVAHITVHLRDFPNRRLALTRMKHDVPYARRPLFRIQFPLDLAWACTVHKGQGQTLDPTVYDGREQFASGGGYTALSRAPGFDKLFFIDRGERQGYFIADDVKRLLEWIDVHDLNSGWDEKAKRAPVPTVKPQKYKNMLDIQKKKMEPKRKKGEPVNPIPDPIDPEQFVNPDDYDLGIVPATASENLDQVSLILEQIRAIPVHPETASGIPEAELMEYVRRAEQILNEAGETVREIQRKVEERSAVFDFLRQSNFVDQQGCQKIYREMLFYYLVMKTVGDGHCLFRALSWAIFGHPDSFLQLRLLSCKIMVDHHEYFAKSVNLLSSMRGVTFNDMVHSTCIVNPNRNAGWGDGYNAKSIAIAARRKLYVYQELVDPRSFDDHSVAKVQGHIRFSPHGHRAYHPCPAEERQGSRALCILFVNPGMANAHYLGMLPASSSTTMAPEFPIYFRMDVVRAIPQIAHVWLDTPPDETVEEIEHEEVFPTPPKTSVKSTNKRGRDSVSPLISPVKTPLFSPKRICHPSGPFESLTTLDKSVIGSDIPLSPVERKDVTGKLLDPPVDEHDLSLFLQMNGLQKASVIGDGNCLYRAVGMSITGVDHPNLHREYRRLAAEYFQSHMNEFKPYFDESIETPVARLAKMQTVDTWASELEAVCLALTLHVDLYVWAPPPTKNPETATCVRRLLLNVDNADTWDKYVIIYNGSNHYDGVVAPSREGAVSDNEASIIENFHEARKAVLETTFMYPGSPEEMDVENDDGLDEDEPDEAAALLEWQIPVAPKRQPTAYEIANMRNINVIFSDEED